MNSTRTELLKAKWLFFLLAQIFAESAAWGIMSQQSYLKPSDIAAGDNFGWTVSISGNTIVVGVPFENSSTGGAYVFVRDGTNWIEQAHLVASNASAGDQFGASVSISGGHLVVGANHESSDAANSGAAYAFVRQGTNWTQQGYLKASNIDTNDQFGWSVAISGNTIVVGARFEDSRFPGVQTDNSLASSGAAYVFTLSGTNWVQQAYLKPHNPGLNFNFGWAVSISSNTIVVGTPFESSTAVASGAVYAFIRSGTNWTQQAYLKASNAGLQHQLGASVSVWGDTLIAGANRESSVATNSGAAYIFARNGTNWAQQAHLKASNLGAEDQFGWFVGINTDTAVISAKLEDSQAAAVNGEGSDDSFVNSGAAYVFVREGTNWLQQAYLKAANTGTGDQFGYSSAISDDTVVLGAPLEQSSTGDPSDDSAFQAGAAYVFTGFTPPPRLSVAPSNGHVQISWPLRAADFQLEETGTLDETTVTNWTSVPPPYQTNGTQISVNLQQPAGGKFFRLRK